MVRPRSIAPISAPLLTSRGRKAANSPTRDPFGSPKQPGTARRIMPRVAKYGPTTHRAACLGSWSRRTIAVEVYRHDAPFCFHSGQRVAVRPGGPEGVDAEFFVRQNFLRSLDDVSIEQSPGQCLGDHKFVDLAVSRRDCRSRGTYRAREWIGLSRLLRPRISQ
jgi:hypothetical protein